MMAAARYAQSRPDVVGHEVDQGNGEDQEPGPEITERWIRLNGYYATGGAHETFLIPTDRADACNNPYRKAEKGVMRDFCKTAQKPYDIVVAGCLALLDHHAPDGIIVTSDGDLEEWMPAVKAVREFFGDPSINAPRGVQQWDAEAYTAPYRAEYRRKHASAEFMLEQHAKLMQQEVA